MENNPWAVDYQQPQMQQMPQQMMQPQQMPQQPQQDAGYPALANDYGLGSQKKKNDVPNASMSNSPWLWTGESNSR